MKLRSRNSSVVVTHRQVPNVGVRCAAGALDCGRSSYRFSGLAIRGRRRCGLRHSAQSSFCDWIPGGAKITWAERGSVGVPPAVSGASRSRLEGAGRMPTPQRARRPRYKSRVAVYTESPVFSFYVAHTPLPLPFSPYTLPFGLEDECFLSHPEARSRPSARAARLAAAQDRPSWRGRRSAGEHHGVVRPGLAARCERN